MQAAAPTGSQFHFIGRVQGRQLAKLAPFCVAIHSLCDADHITRLGRACVESGRRIEAFIQVNVADDPAKAGVRPGDLAERVELARRTTGLELVGLMTMAPLGPEGGQADEATIRRCFAALRGLAEIHHLPRLSMGMSEDFIHAIAEGATDVRIGSRLFR
jgi:PLP dependent protein